MEGSLVPIGREADVQYTIRYREPDGSERHARKRTELGAKAFVATHPDYIHIEKRTTELFRFADAPQA